MPSPQQTLDQKRAAAAWQNVTNALNHAKQAAQVALTEAEQENNRRRAEELQRVLNNLKSKEGGDDFRGAYGKLARKTPALIMSAGLGQTVAFLRAKGKGVGWNEHQVLYKHISEWVVARLPVQANDLLEVVRENSSDLYRQATAEAIAFLGWLKRFAEAELPEAEGER